MNKLSNSGMVKRALLALGATALMLGSLQVHASADKPRVRFQTNQGVIVVELDAKAAPKTVANFVQYVRDKHYDGTVFHRVISNFMVQGGGFTPELQQKPTRAGIAHEGAQASANGAPRNTIGTIAMARTQDPNSASAQFFINVADNAFLDYRAPTMQGYGYVAFGRVVEGMDVVNAIRSVATGAAGPFPSDVPKTPIVIQTATMEQ
jgi:peptidyl-prolyl cis-trans isomerase A (cyclophilin A)|tara:strand:- start:611 stop:1231 length:621 start_codon:yes stop_codon:yes gene_type:complete